MATVMLNSIPHFSSINITTYCDDTTHNQSSLCHTSQMSETGHHEKPWSMFRLPLYVVVLLSVAYSVVGLLGLVNNTLVIVVIYRQAKLRTATNYFLANLATADIMVCLLVLPITLLENIMTEWRYGEVICKTAPYLQGVAVSASVNTLAALSVERFFAICWHKSSKLSPNGAVFIIGIIWIIPLVIFIPWILVYREVVHDVSGYDYVTCHAAWENSDHYKLFTLIVVFLTCYIIPLAVVALFYLLIGIKVWRRRVQGIRGSAAERSISRSKTKIVRMLIVVVVLFALSWLPLYSISFRVMFGSPLTSEERSVLKRYLTPVAQWLGASNSCVNPFVYCYFNYSFRAAFRDVCNRSRRSISAAATV